MTQREIKDLVEELLHQAGSSGISYAELAESVAQMSETPVEEIEGNLKAALMTRARYKHIVKKGDRWYMAYALEEHEPEDDSSKVYSLTFERVTEEAGPAESLILFILPYKDGEWVEILPPTNSPHVRVTEVKERVPVENLPQGAFCMRAYAIRWESSEGDGPDEPIILEKNRYVVVQLQ